MKRTMQLNLLDKILMFYESVFFIFFATYQMLPKIQTAKILSCLHIALIFSFLSAFILFVRAFLSKKYNVGKRQIGFIHVNNFKHDDYCIFYEIIQIYFIEKRAVISVFT